MSALEAARLLLERHERGLRLADEDAVEVASAYLDLEARLARLTRLADHPNPLVRMAYRAALAAELDQEKPNA